MATTDRPELPRRKSSASETDDAHARKSGHRKTFHVGGGATRNHTRVPSYGKKLNQLGKLTALTTHDSKTALTEAANHGSPRQGVLVRSASQKSLSSKRNYSAQELKRSRNGGSSVNLATSKGDAAHVSKEHRKSSKIAETQKQRAQTDPHASLPGPTGVKPKFSIPDDDDDDEAEEVSYLGTDEEHADEKPEHVEKPDSDGVSAKAPQKQNRGSPNGKANAQSARTTHGDAEDTSADTVNDTASQPPATPLQPERRPRNLLAHATVSPAPTKLTIDAVVSKDIQVASRSQSSEVLGSNSQPITSRFLESPRRQAGSARLNDATPSNSYKEEMLRSPGLARPSGGVISQASQLAPSSTLGGGTSRTQQKLLLQRASSIYNLDGYTDENDDASARLAHPKALKEIERISKEYRNVCRYRAPIKELVAHIEPALALGRPARNQTMFRSATALNLNNNENRSPRSSQSHSNLARDATMSQANRVSQDKTAIDQVLESLWNEPLTAD